MSIPSPQTFSPGSATFIFLPCKGSTLKETFAKGSAVALEDGVTAAVRPASTSRVFFNGLDIELPPVKYVLDQIAPEPMEVHLETSLPLGCGFGVSAGCSLTTTFALAKRFDLEMTREELGMIAHAAEVNSGTGIGDVTTQLSGGIVYRRGERGPFDCVKMDLNPDPLHYCIFGPISTQEILNDPHFQQTLAREGESGLTWLRENHQSTSLEALLDRSLEFAGRTDLLRSESVRTAIDAIRAQGGHATMVMLGQSVIATHPHRELQRSIDINWHTCRVDQEGTRWL